MAMDSFTPAPPPPAAVVKSVQIVLTITDAVPASGQNPAIPKAYQARYSFDQLAADGTIVHTREGNLVPHLTAPQLTQAKAFMDAMLTKAQGSVG